MAVSHVRQNVLYLNAVTTAFNKRPRWFEYAYCDSSTFRPFLHGVGDPGLVG